MVVAPVEVVLVAFVEVQLLVVVEKQVLVAALVDVALVDVMRTERVGRYVLQVEEKYALFDFVGRGEPASAHLAEVDCWALD